MGQRLRAWCGWLVALALLLADPSAHAGALDASVDRSRLGRGETLQLTLTYDAQVVFGEPDFSSLDHDFEILGSSRQSQLSVVNGSNQSSTAWRLTLSPRRSGRLVIPSLNFKGAVSDAVEVEVADTAPDTARAGRELFTEALVDRDNAYVQQQILLTLRLFSTETTENLTFEAPAIANASLKELGKSQYQKVIDGHTYLVSEIRFAVFAETSGELRIPPAHFSGIVVDRSDPFGNPFFSRSGRHIAVESQPQSVRIKPRATTAAGATWLPSAAVGFSERWSTNAATLTAGEPITRTITLTAMGLTAAQLPPLPTSTGGGLQTYPDQPQLDDKLSDQGISGRRIESTALVPTTPGTLTLPEIRIEWWDTGADQRREAVLPGRTFTVVAAAGAPVPSAPRAAGAAPPAPAPGADATSTPVLVLGLAAGNLALLALALVFAGLWWRARRPAPATGPQSRARGDDSAVFARIGAAAGERDFAALRNATLAWAQQRWPAAPVAGLGDVAGLARGDLARELRASFAALDHHLYAAGPAPDAGALWRALQSLHAQAPPTSTTATARDGLAPLYPIAIDRAPAPPTEPSP